MIGKINTEIIDYSVKLDISRYRSILVASSREDTLIPLIMKACKMVQCPFIFIDPWGIWSKVRVNDIRILSLKVGVDLRFNPILHPENISPSLHTDLLHHLIINLNRYFKPRFPGYWSLVFCQTIEKVSSSQMDLSEVFLKIDEYTEASSGLEKYAYVSLRNIVREIFSREEFKYFDTDKRLTLDILLTSLSNFDGILLELSLMKNSLIRSLLTGILTYYILNTNNSRVEITLLLGEPEPLYTSPSLCNLLGPNKSRRRLIFFAESPSLLDRSFLTKIDLIIGERSYRTYFAPRKSNISNKYFLLKDDVIINFNTADLNLEEYEEKTTYITSEEEDLISLYKELVVSIISLLHNHGGMGLKGIIALNPSYGPSTIYRVVNHLLDQNYVRFKQIGSQRILTLSVKGLMYYRKVIRHGGKEI
jgi:hypothetical protein